jgi:hypothetical protein
VPFLSLKAAAVVRRTLQHLQPLVPVALFVLPLVAIGALAASAATRSVVLVGVATAAVVVSFGGLAAWTVTADRRARKPPSHVPWSDKDWGRFERALWAHVRHRSDLSRPPGSE